MYAELRNNRGTRNEAPSSVWISPIIEAFPTTEYVHTARGGGASLADTPQPQRGVYPVRFGISKEPGHSSISRVVEIGPALVPAWVSSCGSRVGRVGSAESWLGVTTDVRLQSIMFALVAQGEGVKLNEIQMRRFYAGAVYNLQIGVP